MLLPGRRPDAASARVDTQEAPRGPSHDHADCNGLSGSLKVRRGYCADRVAALRNAFDAAMADPKFLADAQMVRIAISPLSGAKVQDIVAKLYATPKAIVERAKQVIKP